MLNLSVVWLHLRLVSWTKGTSLAFYTVFSFNQLDDVNKQSLGVSFYLFGCDFESLNMTDLKSRYDEEKSLREAADQRLGKLTEQLQKEKEENERLQTELVSSHAEFPLSFYSLLTGLESCFVWTFVNAVLLFEGILLNRCNEIRLPQSCVVEESKQMVQFFHQCQGTLQTNNLQLCAFVLFVCVYCVAFKIGLQPSYKFWFWSFKHPHAVDPFRYY